MTKLFQESKSPSFHKPWADCRIGITGASGALGCALSKKFRKKGAYVIGLTHRPANDTKLNELGPNEWVQWFCGQEELLDGTLANLDILIVNHGINPKGKQSNIDLNNALQINALSSWRLMERFEVVIRNDRITRAREIWINTSEAELMPALSPAYEISKRLIGNLVSIKWNQLDMDLKNVLKIRKLILGPFRSELNPLGIMEADFVADRIIDQSMFDFTLIIVSPNPMTYLLMPITEIFRCIYSKVLSWLL